MTCILSNNNVGQASDRLVHVNCHSFKSRLLSLQLHTPSLSYLPSLICICFFCFFFSMFTRREDITKGLHRRLIFSYLSTSPLQIKWLLLHQTKMNRLYIGMELKKNWTSVKKYEEPITLIMKTDYSFVHFRFLNLFRPLVKLIFKN